MPRTTAAYPFEGRIWSALQRRFAGLLSLHDEGASLLVELSSSGEHRARVFSPDTPASGLAARDESERGGAAHVFLDPLDDGREYVALSWSGVERSTMERLIGESFETSDFVHFRTAARTDYPSSWSVMF